MKQLKYCTRCVMPNSKPFLEFDASGVCSACRSHELKRAHRNGIDWPARLRQFESLLEKAKQRHSPTYDALVPVSGGKDSFFQVHTALEYGLRVLAVNVDYGIKTEVGRRNLEHIPRMGASLLVLRPELKHHTRMIRIGFEDYGDPDLMSHGLLYAFPMWTAVWLGIPLVLWGENSAFEYGGDLQSRQKSHIDHDWFQRYVMTQGVDARLFGRQYGIPEDVLRIYQFPESELRAAGTQAVFMSHYFPWDSQHHLEIAHRLGFESLQHPREGTFRNYVGIDEKINRVHQYMKVLKFGYGRATDHACEEIRNERMSRVEAIRLVRQHDRAPLGSDYIHDFISFLGYQRAEFDDIMARYRNREIWQEIDGNWVLNDASLDE